ncbi:hypothetical protein R5R35_014811 [Gryllus longicercus]|uniref:Chitin-binding type-2 domain-containing protein n=1 Tax=Gryllus longicercus TaxID=2509291 RepID=A0AAN9Z7Z2_9ORTH
MDARRMLAALLLLWLRALLLAPDSSVAGARAKRPRAPRDDLANTPPPDTARAVVRSAGGGGEGGDVDRAVARPEASVPPGFLSPSVRAYLELGKSIPGRPGTDYPVLARVPYTNFYCDDQRWPGFFADPETRCQTWHYCDIDGRQATFLCPNGTQFSQAVFVCDWWFNVRCDLSRALYAINARLYGPPRPDPTRPHRLITKELLDNIFV